MDLTRTCTKGVKVYWLRRNAPRLLHLRCVEQRTGKSDPTDEELLDALIELLRELSPDLDSPELRIVADTVLALDPRYRKMNAHERRTLAGQLFRGGDDVVTAETIRKIYEPQAVRALAALLHAEEMKFWP